MALHKNLEKHIKTLSPNKLEGLFNILSSLLVAPTYSSAFNAEIKEMKYFKGGICPRCNENHIIKYGKRYGRQRFKSKNVERFLMRELLLQFLVQNYHLINVLNI